MSRFAGQKFHVNVTLEEKDTSPLIVCYFLKKTALRIMEKIRVAFSNFHKISKHPRSQKTIKDQFCPLVEGNPLDGSS